jgi:uncharacterized membrane-anchored protein
MLNKKYVARKVPEITALFWIIKLLTTAMGESTSDFLVAKFNPYVAVACGGIVFLIALILQFHVKKYIPFVYWFTVSMVAVFGTMAADGLHVQLGVPYLISASSFAIILALVFILWYHYERTLSIHHINSRRREIFYWLTVLATFALGTAVGDLSATTFGLGYFSSAIVFLIIIAIPATAYLLTKRHEVLYFWFAYIITRPIGASFSDWFGKSKSVGSLGFGDGHVSITLTTIIIVLVSIVTVQNKFKRHTEQGRITSH